MQPAPDPEPAGPSSSGASDVAGAPPAGPSRTGLSDAAGALLVARASLSRRRRVALAALRVLVIALTAMVLYAFVVQLAR